MVGDIHARRRLLPAPGEPAGEYDGGTCGRRYTYLLPLSGFDTAVEEERDEAEEKEDNDAAHVDRYSKDMFFG